MIRYHIDEVMYFRYPAAGGETHGLRVRGWAFDGESDRTLDYTGQFNDGEKNDIMPVRFPRIDVTSRLDNAENAGDSFFHEGTSFELTISARDNMYYIRDCLECQCLRTLRDCGALCVVMVGWESAKTS